MRGLAWCLGDSMGDPAWVEGGLESRVVEIKI